jgi:DNA topoisomerase-1
VAFLDKGIGTRSVVIDVLNDALAPHFFPDLGNGKAPRACPACGNGELGIKLAKNGAFIGCNNYPECKYTKPLAVQTEEEIAAGSAGPVEFGKDEQGRSITLRKGPYGFYVQLGEGEDGGKPKRVSLTRDLDPNAVNLEIAQKLLSLPRVVGHHPETQKPIMAGIGRFGPYLNHDGKFKSIPKDDDVLTIGMNRAVELLSQESKGRGGRQAAPGKEIGKHPQSGEAVTLHEGKYGPYVKMGAVNATLPKSIEPGAVTLEEALSLIAARAEAGGGKGKKKTAPKAAKKAVAKKATAKTAEPKTAAKKAATKTKTVKKVVKKATKKSTKRDD